MCGLWGRRRIVLNPFPRFLWNSTQANSTSKLFILTFTTLQQWIDCKTVRIFAYSSTREQSNKRSRTRLKTESETGERRVFFLSPHTPYGRVRLARFARMKLIRHALPFSFPILRKNRLVCSLKNGKTIHLLPPWNICKFGLEISYGELVSFVCHEHHQHDPNNLKIECDAFCVSGLGDGVSTVEGEVRKGGTVVTGWGGFSGFCKGPVII